MHIIERPNIHDLVIEQILLMIEKKELKPGARLPGERQLAKELGIGRHSLREAFKKLELMGIISIQPGNGTFIRKHPPESFKEALTSLMILGGFSARDLIEMRECVEIYAIKLAIKRANPSDIQELGHYCNEMEKAIAENDKECFVEYDIRFHLHIVKSTLNPLLWQVANSFQDLLYGAQKILEANESILKRSIRDHRQIYEAFIDRDIRTAEAIMERHLRDVESHFVSMRMKKPDNI